MEHDITVETSFDSPVRKKDLKKSKFDKYEAEILRPPTEEELENTKIGKEKRNRGIILTVLVIVLLIVFFFGRLF